MKQVILVSNDSDFVSRVASRFGEHEKLQHLTAAQADRLITKAMAGHLILAFDCRDACQSEAEGIVVEARRRGGPNLRIAAICTDVSRRSMQVIGAAGAVVNDVIILESDEPGVVLRAFMNDPLNTCATALAYQILAPCFPSSIRGYLGEVLGGGFCVSSVKQLASLLSCDRSTLQRNMRRVGAGALNDLIELAQASAAVLMSGAGGCSTDSIAHAVGYSKAESVDRLVLRVFHRSLALCRRAAAGPGQESVLSVLLADRPRR